MRVAIITASDTGAEGKREDKSGSLIREIVTNLGAEVVSYTLLPDERTLLSDEMRRLADDKVADLILTTGGTGFSKRDCTPEATLDVVERLVPGIPEAMRAYSMQFTGRAMLSRAMAGIRGDSLIVNMPGSPKAIGETLEYIYPHICHGIDILTGVAKDCARKKNKVVLGICGVKNSGKTTYITALVKELKDRNLSVAVIKHDGHDFTADVPGTDSAKFYEAGADATAVYSDRHLMIHERRDDSASELCDELKKRFRHYDVILVEGCKESDLLKVEIVRAAISNAVSSNPKNRVGVITDLSEIQGLGTDEVCFALDDVVALADEITRRIG